MFFLVMSCFSFIFVFKSSFVNLFLLNLTNMRLLSPMFCLKQLCNALISYTITKVVGCFRPMLKDSTNHENLNIVDDELGRMSLLDLPELAIDSILERLSPAELCSMAGVCSYLRAKCTSDDMWEKHMKKKWGRLIGNAACREWQWYLASNMRKYSMRSGEYGRVFRSVFSFWPLSLMRLKFGGRSENEVHLLPNSIMAWYLSLEHGKFWFPAQVYNRENGHDGFMLSCYDAELSYNMKTNSFRARYSSSRPNTMEENISWNRLRAPPVDTPAYDLHISDCLDDLKPRDHVEIQWRRNKQYPYGWWYGVVGHLESCGGDGNICSCNHSDMVILEFNQYAPNSRWRRITVSRKNHREEGNEAHGFHGGIRKLHNQEEISAWKSLWPNKVLD